MTEQEILKEAKAAALQRAQERTRKAADKTAREIAEAGAMKERDGDKAMSVWNRVFSHAFPILFEQYFPRIHEEETKIELEKRLLADSKK